MKLSFLNVIEYIKYKRYLIMLILLIIFFSFQSYILFAQFIPNVLSVYKEVLPAENLIVLNNIFEKIASWYMVWPILTFSLLISMIIQKKNKNI